LLKDVSAENARAAAKRGLRQLHGERFA